MAGQVSPQSSVFCAVVAASLRQGDRDSGVTYAPHSQAFARMRHCELL